MANDLVVPEDLLHLPSAPFTDEEVDAAVSALRVAVRWHIAPVRTETVVFDVKASECLLQLSTRKLVSVDEIRSGGVVVDVADYQVSIELAQVVRSYGFWPRGVGGVQVDFTHGHAGVPPDLLPVIAETATSQRLIAVRASVVEQPARVGEGVGGNIVSANPLTPRMLGHDVLDRYALFPAGFA